MSRQRSLPDLIASVPEVNRWKLDREIDFENKDIRGRTIPQHLGRIAAVMNKWEEELAIPLGLNETDLADIVDRNMLKPGLQRRDALSMWKAGLGSQATYKALMEVFVKAGRVDCAETIVEILKEGAEMTEASSGPQGGSTSVASAARTAVPTGNVGAAGGDVQGAAATPQSVGLQAQIPNTSTNAAAMLVFSSAMKRDQLGQWLLQEFGEDYEDEIGHITRAKINGALFLMLSENEELLKSLELPIAFKVLVLEKVKALKESMNPSATSVSSNEALLPGPPSSEVSPQVFKCGTAELDTPTTTTDSASPESGVREAWAPKNIIWPQGKSVLQVKFLNVIPTTWKYKGGGLNFGNIEQWANIWSTSVQGGGIIPQFQFAAGGNAPSDIRVKFVGGTESSRSVLGKRAQDYGPDQPTMWLNLSSGGDDFKMHTVIHEFGHALGLGHEHQRSDFWKIVEQYIDVDAIKQEVGEKTFDDNWGKDSKYNKKNANKYDPLSVMHYSFKKEWLKSEYSDTAKVDEALKKEYISKKAADVLCGIIKRAGNPYVTAPSTDDIDQLVKLYSYGTSRGGTCTIQAQPPPGTRVRADSPTFIETTPATDQTAAAPPGTAGMPRVADAEFDRFEVKHHFVNRLEWKYSATGEIKCIKVYNKAEVEWREVANSLGLELGEIRGIQRNNYSDDERVTDVFRHWFDNANNLPNKEKYPKKWSGLIRLLKDSNLGVLSEEVEKALTAPYSNVRGNL